MTKLVLTTIVSGAQTGADRAGLDAAIALDLAYGGWMPLGRKAEDGIIPEIYANRMRESPSPSYALRTRLNVQDSDATLIVSFSSFRSGGTQLTADTAQRMRKPCKHLVLPARGETRIPDGVAAEIRAWLAENRVVVLNVAGPRESKEPGLQAAVRDALVWILEDEVRVRTTPFAQRCKDLASWIAQSRGQADWIGLDGVDELIEEYYTFPGNLAGGSLHIVLDDGNTERECVQFCLEYARKENDTDGIALAELLLSLTDEEIVEACGKDYCGQCCQDFEDGVEHVCTIIDERGNITPVPPAPDLADLARTADELRGIMTGCPKEIRVNADPLVPVGKLKIVHHGDEIAANLDATRALTTFVPWTPDAEVVRRTFVDRAVEEIAAIVSSDPALAAGPSVAYPSGLALAHPGPCSRCGGRGWYPETFEVDGHEDQRERYCECPAGVARSASE